MPKKERACYEVAVDLLSRRDHAPKELATKLLKKFPKQEVLETLERLMENRFLNAQRFADNRLRSRVFGSGWGEIRVIHELKDLGIEKPTIMAAFETFFEENETFTFAHHAQTVALQKFKTPLPSTQPERDKEYNKRLGFLVRRGFNAKEAADAIAVTDGTPELA